MYKDIEKVLISKKELDIMVKKVAKEITEEYKDKPLVIIGVMKGSLIFLADLLREIPLKVEYGTVAASSYGASTVTTGQVKIVNDIDVNIEGKNVLIVEDLIDTGHTLKYLQEFFELRNPKSIKICVAFDKKARREKAVDIDFTGMLIPDEFIVGYGLDFDEKYRNLPEVCVLKEELYIWYLQSNMLEFMEVMNRRGDLYWKYLKTLVFILY